MIKFIDENGDSFSIVGVRMYATEQWSRRVYEAQYGSSWDEPTDPKVCVFYVTTTKRNVLSFGVPFARKGQVQKELSGGEDVTICVERPRFAVDMTEDEFRMMVQDFDYEADDYTEGDDYIDFDVRVSDSFFSKVEVYRDLDEARKDLSDNFPDGGRWSVSIMACTNGNAYCEMTPPYDYTGEKEPFSFKFKGACLDAIHKMAEDIKAEKRKGR
jgi:hypothetical protein